MIKPNERYAVCQKIEFGWLIIWKASRKLAMKRLKAIGGSRNGYRIYLTDKRIGETIEA